MVKVLDKALTQQILVDILEIEAQCFGDERWDRENIERELPGKWEYSVIIYSESIIGYLIAALIASDSLHIYRIAIHPRYQGKSWGSQLLAHAINHYERKGIRYVTVEVDARFPVDHFYTKNGFDRLQGPDLLEYIQLRDRSESVGLYLEDKNRIYRYRFGE